MHTVNTYVSCQSRLHSNSPHSNARLLRSATSEVGCFHGNRAAAFNGGSRETTPADKAGSSDPPTPSETEKEWASGIRVGGTENGERQLFLVKSDSDVQQIKPIRNRSECVNGHVSRKEPSNVCPLAAPPQLHAHTPPLPLQTDHVSENVPPKLFSLRITRSIIIWRWQLALYFSTGTL